MSAHPELVYIGTDMKNAFGTMHRAYAMAAAHAAVPDLAQCLEALWTTASPVMMLDGPNGHEAHTIYDALCQGGCDAAPAFCLGIARFTRRIREECRRRDRGSPLGLGG